MTDFDTTTPSPRALQLARTGADLDARHDRDLQNALQPIRDALGAGPDADARLLAVLQDASKAADDASALDVFRAAVAAPRPPAPVPLTDVTDELPRPLLSVARHDGRRDGALLSAGGVCLLAGAGSAMKSTLALRLALEAAATPAGNDRAALDGRLVVIGGPVLFATFEDAPAWLRYRAARMVETLTLPADAMRGVHVLNLSGWPLFGPAAGDPLTARPGPLPGWSALWDAVDQTGARVVVVDPALCAYVGEANSAAPVREFLTALTAAAGARGAGVLLIAHSTKAARSGVAPVSVYDAGHVGGSTHWTDGARAALTLTRRDGGSSLVLAIAKANYSAAYRHVRLTAVSHYVLSAAAGDAWTEGEPTASAEAKPTASNGKAARNGREPDMAERAALDAL